MKTMALTLVVMMTAFLGAIQSARADLVEVDVELALMVDVSRSMSSNELEIQRRGYAEALRSPEVIKAITGGLIGRVALTYIEWAGNFGQRVIVDWTMVDSAEGSIAFADKLTAEFNSSLRRTSISGAIDYAADSLEHNAFDANRRVIDISGDGPNNQGRAVTDARDEAIARGISINGLPLMTKEGMGSMFQLDDLDVYYRNCVIGGTGAFVVPVRDWAEFPAAVRQKLIWELAGIQPIPVVRAGFHDDLGDGRDCFIGEKMWERIQRQWFEE